MKLDRAATTFVIHNLLKLHIHCIPKVDKMQSGHSKRMLDGSIERLARYLTHSLAENGVEFSKADPAGDSKAE